MAEGMEPLLADLAALFKRPAPDQSPADDRGERRRTAAPKGR
jgi:hypothetical protein